MPMPKRGTFLEIRVDLLGKSVADGGFDCIIVVQDALRKCSIYTSMLMPSGCTNTRQFQTKKKFRQNGEYYRDRLVEK